MTSPIAQVTDFSKDILGRYICNGLDEAMASTLGGARPFDIIIIGGGSFGSALAQHVLYSDKFRTHRVLVLEAGPFILAEHTQNLPTLGLFPPPEVQTDPGVTRAEVWGFPWITDIPNGFPGLAYCIGGRSLFWGGWSPRLLEAEMPPDRWPQTVVADLEKPDGFFDQSARQIGVDESNDFVFGEMHVALRGLLAAGLGGIPAAIPLAQIPPHLGEQARAGLTQAQIDELNLEAPLAVQGREDRSGFFPMNKFSGVPLLMRASRQAYMESPGNDPNKRLMVVPNCHVTFLETPITDGAGQVSVVHTNHDSPQFPGIPVPPRGVVVLASGTIESTRLALLSFQGALGYELIGTNLMAHMRSNYAVVMPRTVVAVPPTGDLQGSALFLKCRTTHADGSVSHFHLQITAAGIKGIGGSSDGELYQMIPDIDTIDVFRHADEDHIAMTLRGVAEIQPGNPDNRVTLSDTTDEFGMRRAFVTMGDPRSTTPTPGESQQTANDRDTWQVMDQTSDQALAAFTTPANVQQIGRRRDGLGTTHHESGTLRIGLDPASSVTTPHGRFHHVINAYAVGPALLPSMGSPNPMLSGVALARRLAEHMVAPLAPPPLESGFQWLFDGTAATFHNWVQAGPGNFQLDAAEGVMTAFPGNDIGLLFYAAEAFSDFTLRLQFRVDAHTDNSGVFVRFLDPRIPAPQLGDPRTATNPAWIAVHSGFEIQIDDTARDDGADKHRTGAVYDIDIGTAAGQQAYHRGSSLQPGEWNDYEIVVTGDSYTVRLNELETAVFTNTTADRGRPASEVANSGFVGLQTHTGQVSFRAVQIGPA